MSSETSQRPSEATGGNQRPSEAIRGNQRPTEVIRGHQRPTEVIRVHQRSSEVPQQSSPGCSSATSGMMPPHSKMSC